MHIYDLLKTEEAASEEPEAVHEEKSSLNEHRKLK